MRRLGLALSILGIVLVGACARKNASLAAYSPHENLLSIAAEFELLDSRDPYRQPPAEDLTGQNIARATLVRLANYQSLHPGRFAPEVLVLKARAYERLNDFEAARLAYREAAGFDTPMHDECAKRADADERLLAAARLAVEGTTLQESLQGFQQRIAAFTKLAGEFESPEYRAYALIEAENSEVRRAETLAANRWLLPDGETQAAEALRALVANHSESRRGLEHALRLARFYRELAEEEMRLHSPETLDFNAERAMGFLDDALDILYRVSQADGRRERVLAQRELDAVIALKELAQERAD